MIAIFILRWAVEAELLQWVVYKLLSLLCLAV